MKKLTATLLCILAAALSILFVNPVHAAVPVRETDVTAPVAGNTMVIIRGNYYTVSKGTVLKRMNEIRYEACKNGYVNPSTRKKLTLSDYHPIKWSADLEWIAQTRAAEAAVYEDHRRPNGDLCFSCTHNGTGSYGEVLAWNFSGLMNGIEQWYGEKGDWVKQNGQAETGHYTAMINPENTFVALGCFRPECGGYYAVAGEFSSMTGLNESQIGVSGLHDQKMEVNADKAHFYKKYAPHDHTMTYTPAKAPTYTHTGNKAYYTCTGCGKCFFRQRLDQARFPTAGASPRLFFINFLFTETINRYATILFV